MKNLAALLILLNIFQHVSSAQDMHLIDSLKTQLKNHRAVKTELQIKSPSMYDTNAVNILIALSTAYTTQNNDIALQYAREAFNLSEAIGYKKGIAGAYQKAGWVYLNWDNYSKSLTNLEAALRINLETGDMHEAFGCYFGTGHAYLGKGNMPEALKNYFNALKIAETAGNKGQQSRATSGIAGVYSSLGNYTEAKKYILKSMQISEARGDNYELSNAYGFMSELYKEAKDYDKALENGFKGLKLAEEINEIYSVGFDLYEIGLIYCLKEEYPTALDYFSKSLKIAEDKGYKQLQISILNTSGSTYITLKKYAEARQCLNRGLLLSKHIESLEQIQSSYAHLQELDSAEANFKEALRHYKLFVAAGDSIVNNENTKKTVQIQLQYDFDKKLESDSLKFTLEKKITEIKLQKQKALMYGGFAGTAIALVLLFFVYRNFNRQRIANRKLEEAHTQLIKNEKMAAFGVVATRMAHEIHNPLNFVNNFSELSQGMVTDMVESESEEDKKQFADLLTGNLQRIKQHGKRAVAIVNQLQEHSLKGSAHEFFEE